MNKYISRKIKEAFASSIFLSVVNFVEHEMA